MTTFLQATDNAYTVATADTLNNLTTPLTLAGIDTQRFDDVESGYVVTIWDKDNYLQPDEDPSMEQALVTAATIGANGSLTLSRSNPKIHDGAPAIQLLAIARQINDLNTAVTDLEAVAGNLKPVATTGSYTDLADKPVIPTVSGTNTGDETNASIKSKLGISVLSGANTGDQDLSPYATTAAVNAALAAKASSAALATVATSGNYADLSNRPTIPAAYTDTQAAAAAPVQSVAGKTGSVTLNKADVGLGSVDNTADANKPVSTAQATAIALKSDKTYVDSQDSSVATTAQTNLVAHTGRTDNPHAVTKAQIGLSNVDNTADAAKPVSTAQQTAINTASSSKVAKGELVLNIKDYGAIGDGTTDDTAAIQSALNAAATAGGGTVLIPKSTYVVSNIMIDSYVTLQGAGKGSIMLAKAGSTGFMISLKTPASTQQTVLRDFTLKPNTGTLGGVKLDNTGFGTAIDPIHVIENLVVLNAGGDAFYFDNSMRELQVRGCYVHYAGGRGFYIGAGTTDSRFIGNTTGPTTGHGYEIVGNNNNFIGCKAFYAGFNGTTWNTTSNGFRLAGTNYSTMTSCSAQQNARHGFSIESCSRCGIVGCESDTNSAGGSGGVGFNTSWTTYSSVAHCTGANNGILSPGAQLYGVQVDGVQTGLQFFGNSVTGSGGDFGYVSGYGYMVIGSSLVDLTAIPTKINNVTQFALMGATSGSVALVAAAVASGSLTLPSATDTLVGRNTTDTLTAKTMSGASNTFSNIPESAITNLTTDLAAKVPATRAVNGKALSADIALNNTDVGAAATSHTHGVADLTATGTKSSSTFLRGDNTWAAPSGGGGLSAVFSSFQAVGTSRAAYGTGRWYMANDLGGGNWGNFTPQDGMTYYMPYVCPRNMTISALGVSVPISDASGSVRCGIYTNVSAADPYPSALISGSDTGVIACSATGFKSAAVSVNLTAGTLYWFATVVTSSGALVLNIPSVADSYGILGHPDGNSTPGGGWYRNWEGAAANALSTSAPSTATLYSGIPVCPIFKMSA